MQIKVNQQLVRMRVRSTRVVVNTGVVKSIKDHHVEVQWFNTNQKIVSYHYPEIYNCEFIENGIEVIAHTRSGACWRLLLFLNTHITRVMKERK